MKLSCLTCHSPFDIPENERLFLKKIAFPFDSTTIHPAAPKQCPDCRTQIRTCHRNERFLYRRKSDFSGRDVVSLYASDAVSSASFKVFSQEEWRSESWDPLDFGREVNLSEPVFPQLAALQRDVPRMALITVGNENSDFTTGTGYCKNCYLINSSEYCEDCYYGKLLQRCVSSVDCSYLYDSELCYECFGASNCYSCQYLAFSQNCHDCYFSIGLKGCRNCCLSTNLDRKEYYFLNKPLSKQEYHRRVAEFLGSFENVEKMKLQWQLIISRMPHRFANIVNSEDCSGDFIENSKNCNFCFDITDSRDCRFVQVGVQATDVQHSSNMYLRPELCYETLGTIEVNTIAYCLYVFHSQWLLYCDYCFNCQHCFGCSGLTRKQYCIFNRQYTKEQYEVLVPRIIEDMRETGEWGLFFPPALSAFGYNESLAAEYFPLTEEQALERGFNYRSKDLRDYRQQSYSVSDRIEEVPDDITKETLACFDCGRNYRIIQQELAFYRRQNIPVPRRCPDCRYLERLKLRNPRRLWRRICDKCQTAVSSTFAPERSETILCESCYQALRL